MLTIPLYIFLFLFFVFLAVFFSFLFINVYHIATGGSLTIISFFVTLVVCVLTALVLFQTKVMVSGAPWQSSVAVLRADWFFGPSTDL